MDLNSWIIGAPVRLQMALPWKMQCWESATCPPESEGHIIERLPKTAIDKIQLQVQCMMNVICIDRSWWRMTGGISHLHLCRPAAENVLLASLSGRCVWGRNRLGVLTVQTSHRAGVPDVKTTGFGGSIPSCWESITFGHAAIIQSRRWICIIINIPSPCKCPEWIDY